MAVFTDVSEQQVVLLLQEYDLGDFVSVRGIVSGIENSNFYLDTSVGKYVLTVFERLTEQQIPYYLELTHHIYKKGLLVSGPIPTKDGRLSTHVSGKPCSIAPCIPGEYIPNPNVDACAQMGKFLAKMHLAVADFALTQENTKGLEFWLESYPLIKPYIPADVAELLGNEISRMQEVFGSEQYKKLPSGAVHADLFRNNALIELKDGNQQLAGVIDFYFACNAPFLYDLAVAVNDWCVNLDTGDFIEDKVHSFINSYNSVVPLGKEDRAMWQDMLCAAALRFWVSRLYDFYLPRQASLLKPHDPKHFEKILVKRRNTPTDKLPWVS